MSEYEVNFKSSWILLGSDAIRIELYNNEMNESHEEKKWLFHFSVNEWTQKTCFFEQTHFYSESRHFQVLQNEWMNEWVGMNEWVSEE